MTIVTKKARSFSKRSHDSQPQSYDEVLDKDTRPVPAYVRKFGEQLIPGPCEVPVRWYTDRGIYEAEIESIWKRKWQMACRLEHVAAVGDTHVYDVAGLSFIIVRVSQEVIKGYWNSCLHRGVPLRQRSGRVERLQCPFHGFMWGLNGKCLMVPHPEEFPHINREKFSLPEVQVAVWQGFVFINPDLQAQSLESYIDGLDAGFSVFPFTRREIVVHIMKIFPANWKALQEAFLESFHVLTTHPQFATSQAADRCTTFGALGNVSRGIVSLGQTSDYVPYTPDEQEIFRALNEFWDDEEHSQDWALPDGVSARQAYAERARTALRVLLGSAIDGVSDAELVDIFYYTVFPNFNPYGGFAAPMVYRFLPYGNDPEKSVMELMFLRPISAGAEPREPPKPIWLSEDQEFATVEELGSFGAFVSQDSDNLRGIMKGLRNSRTGIVNFARNYESKIRHFYSLYEEAMGLSAAEEVAALKASGKRG
ncbi:MAG TPA: aromatic ring-hydroxylating dioxygenase subunit alpha [Steroidobacteraceae bacterium]|nr:aromatic ring-hydroxylating dioxygenase subunit alpha [Steroidobacteraceae bacterium]